MSLDLETLNAFISANGPTARVVITAHKGSTPRETGASMLVSAETISGTIGGGTLEYQAIEDARALLAEGTSHRAFKHPLGPALGQCCGGSVDLLIERFTKAPLSGRPYARSLSDTPQPLSITRLLSQARQGSPIRPTLTDGWFIEPPTFPATPVWIWGAGHVGRALATALSELPFNVTWVDDAPERFPSKIPANANRLIAASMPDAAKHSPAEAHHIVLTYSHALDLALTHALLQRPHASIGLIGSATKKARFLKRLHAAGLSPATTAKLVCPIGHRALGKEPAAIALGVAFGLLETTRAGQKPASAGKTEGNVA